MSSDKQLVKLIEHYQKALLINSHNSLTYSYLAELYYQQGNLEKTLEICQQALQKQPNSTLILEVLNKVSTRLGFNEDETSYLSEALPTVIMVEEAIAVLVLQTPKEVKSKHKVETWKDAVILGNKLAEQGLWNDAIQSCFTAIALEPSLNFPHFIIQHFILPKIDNPELIANLYFQAIKVPEIHCIAYAILGDTLTKLNKLPEATTAYKKAWLKSNNPTRAEKRLEQERTHIDYLVVGTGKAGTTSLFHYLSQHPQIINPHNKEILFFNEHYEYGLDWYLAQFPPPSFRRERFLTGEATPWYLGTIGVEERVFQYFPHIKLMAILREPVARTISQYYMHLKMGLEHRSLKEAITSELSILKDAENLDQVSETYWKTEQGYLWFSLYLPFLKKWMSLFSKEQFLILNSHDLYNAPSATLSRVFKFLGLPDCDLISYSKMNLGSYPDADYLLRETLFDFFYIHNQELEEYLDVEFGWSNML